MLRVPITDGGGNLDDGTSGSFTDSRSLSNTPDGLDPDGLKNNGGPTQTIALQGDSAAIDAAVDCPPPNTDQRGVVRPQDGDTNGTAACDIGAFELEEPTNSPPDANDDSATTKEDNPVTINVLANDADPDGDTLTVSSVTQPTNGSAALNADNTVTYTPNPDFDDTDTFTYTISDGNGGTDTATVSITVTPVNDAPVATDDSVTVKEGDTVRGEVLTNDTDAEHDTLQAVLVSSPAHGMLTLNPDGTFSYTHDGSETTSDSFTYKTTDGTADSKVATVTITVNAVNNPPSVAVSDGACLSDTKASGRLEFTVSDVDGDNLTFSATSSNTELIPNSNLVTGGSEANRTLTLTAVPKKSGTAKVKVTVSDGTNETTLEVTVKVGTQNADTITGTDGVDVIFGLAGQNTLNGVGGNDLVCGGNGNDTISGGAGNDVLDGGRGDDVINGGDGNDKLLGNAGRDTLRGEKGDDTLTGGTGADSFSGGDGTDRAPDFNAGQADTKDNTIES